MELHAHSHTPRKKWTHYLWEFLMLFLAVFCGFLAENFREHQIEHHRAKQFAGFLLSDLRSDTAALNAAIAFGNKKIKAIDSFFLIVEQPTDRWNDTLMYKYSGVAVRVRTFERSSGTYEQMKASGSLRYFKYELANLLNKYDVQARKTEARENINLKLVLDFFAPLQDQIMDRRMLVQIQDGIAVNHPLVFLKKDKETIALWINYSSSVQGTQKRAIVEYDTMLTKARQIIEALQKEYHLQ